MASVPAEPNTSAPVAPMVSSQSKFELTRGDGRLRHSSNGCLPNSLLIWMPSRRAVMINFGQHSLEIGLKSFLRVNQLTWICPNLRARTTTAIATMQTMTQIMPKKATITLAHLSRNEEQTRWIRKRKRFVVLFSLYISIAKFQLNLSPRNYLKLSHRIRENKV